VDGTYGDTEQFRMRDHMYKIQLLGKQTIGGKQFNGIAGGFGKDKRAILAKDIAEIHGKEVRHVNDAINNNRKRFIDSVDIVDLAIGAKQNGTYAMLLRLGFTKQSLGSVIGKGGNIYALSDRGYAKLLKILKDDVAWEMYELLVNEYFQMKEAMPNESRRLRAEAMHMNAKTRQTKMLKDIALNFQNTLSNESVHLLIGGITEIIMGKLLLPMPIIEKTYSATEIGLELGVTANRIGITANDNNLKTDQYGITVLDKSPHSTKQVPTFRYNERGREKLEELLEGLCQQ